VKKLNKMVKAKVKKENKCKAKKTQMKPRRKQLSMSKKTTAASLLKNQ